MKTLVLLLLLASSTYAQDTQQRIAALEATLQTIQHDMSKCHGQFQIGLATTSFGAVSSVAGILIPDYNTIGASNKATKNTLLIVGAAGLITGAILIIDSHKYIGRAGRFTFEVNAIKLDL